MTILFYDPNEKIFPAAIFCLIVFGACVFQTRAQDVEIKIKISSGAQLRIEEKFLDAKSAKLTNAISFSHSYADADELAERVTDFESFDADGAKIEAVKLAAGEYETSAIPSVFVYGVNLNAPKNPASAAHVSSPTETGALLMLGDLLPQMKGKISGKIIFEIPQDWKISSASARIGANVFAVEDVEKAVFLAGKNFREHFVQVDKTNLSLAISGKWRFSDGEALAMAASILNEYRKMFGEIPAGRTQIFLLPFSQAVVSDRWRAETRGQTVTLISGALSSKREALQRLHEQLRHEIFHLWIPNSVNLTGNYSWFYEGFTVYQALRTGVRLNQIRFEDYLNTLGQAYDLSKNQTASLVEMSDKRWTGIENSVYAKGMIVAFLCDLAMLEKSKGKHSATEIFQKLYAKYHRSKIPVDGGAAIIEILDGYAELAPVVKKYIVGAENIELNNELESFGIEKIKNGGFAQFRVSPVLSGRQKDLLDKLGYNQWRKLLRN